MAITSTGDRHTLVSETPGSAKAGRWLTLGAIAGPLLFTLAWLTLGFLSPGYTIFGTLVAPYSPISQPISGLGLGPTAAWMNSAFVIGGALMLAGVIGIFQGLPGMRPAARWGCAALLALSPLGMVVDGIFTLEAPLLHLAGFLLAVATPIVSFVIVGRQLRSVPGWERLGNRMIWGSPLTLALVVLFFATFDQNAAGAGLGAAGLVQRVLSGEVQAWFVAMAWLALRAR